MADKQTTDKKITNEHPMNEHLKDQRRTELADLIEEASREFCVPIDDVMIKVCGAGSKCQHDWNGPTKECEPGLYSVTCAKCGIPWFNEHAFDVLGG